jgi:hypothetical protein
MRRLSFAGEPEEKSEMKNKLLATVAVAAVVGFGGFAAAQSQMGGDSNKATSGATQTQEKSGGSMSGSQSGSKTLSPSSGQSSNPSKNESAQQKSGKDNERLGQGRNEEQKEMTRGAQEEKRGTEQKGAQQERGMQQKNQKGAQEERGKSLKGAQEQRGTTQEQRGTNVKGAQEERGTNLKGAQEQRGIGGNTTVGERGGSVQLSEDQRSQIKTIVGREHGPRLGKNVNFSISVGTRIPRDVHFVVLPEEIVRIVPQYRGFDYFLVEDEIVIVDPRTLEIVAIIPA